MHAAKALDRIETRIEPIEVASGVFILDGLQHAASVIDTGQLDEVVTELKSSREITPLIYVLVPEDVSERTKQDIIECGTHVVDWDVMSISDALGKGAFPAALITLVGSDAANLMLSIEGKGVPTRILEDLKVEADIDDQTFEVHADGRRGFDDDVYRTWMSRLRSPAAV